MIGIIVSFIPDVCLLLIIFHYGTIEPFISDLSDINPIAIGITAIVYGMHVVVWMWTFIGLKSKYLRAITGYFLFLSSVFCLNRLVFLIAMKISLDTLFLSGAMMASGILFCAVFGIIPFFLLLIGEYIVDKTGYIKKLRKYLNYLYNEKVIWGTNTKKHKEKRRESTNHDERKYETHKSPPDILRQPPGAARGMWMIESHHPIYRRSSSPLFIDSCICCISCSFATTFSISAACSSSACVSTSMPSA